MSARRHAHLNVTSHMLLLIYPTTVVFSSFGREVEGPGLYVIGTNLGIKIEQEHLTEATPKSLRH